MYRRTMYSAQCTGMGPETLLIYSHSYQRERENLTGIFEHIRSSDVENLIDFFSQFQISHYIGSVAIQNELKLYPLNVFYDGILYNTIQLLCWNPLQKTNCKKLKLQTKFGLHAETYRKTTHFKGFIQCSKSNARTQTRATALEKFAVCLSRWTEYIFARKFQNGLTMNAWTYDVET